MAFDLKKMSITLSLTALGLIIGSIVSFLKLPVYLDTIGIMLTTLLLGWRYGVLCAIFTAVVSFFLVGPYVPFFICTMLGVVGFTEFARSRNYYSTVFKSMLAGIGHGIVGTILSVPVIAYVFGGFTSSGNDVIVAFLASKGLNIVVAVTSSLLIFAIIDRILSCVFCHFVSSALPKSFFTKNDFRHHKD